ncbi:hypothetical protein [Methylobacterium pseudosasicola]|uniref:hypothetical protein n=1 Tax=Methylobacterium pseudosasicola TaxID=582667 RepID=UPI0011143240|nr:hypothetical protein [Methylobacterium pseudosasicola]
MTNTVSVTFYPGKGADEKVAELEIMVGKITANWAGVEDGMFEIFYGAITNWDFNADMKTLRALFFTFSSYEQKMRMLHNVIKTKLRDRPEQLNTWIALKKKIDGYSKVRNDIAHLVASCKSSTDPEALANVRLVPPFWKSTNLGHGLDDFNEIGYCAEDLWKAISPYWGYHPKTEQYVRPDTQLAYQIQEFARSFKVTE